jgi:hypothetical protein
VHIAQLGNVLDDARRTIAAAKLAVGSVVSVTEWVKVLQPLADAAVQGDASALAELERLASSPTELPATNAAARVLLEYVKARKQIGTTATRAGIGIYPGQVNPLIWVGVAFAVLLLWRRR